MGVFGDFLAVFGDFLAIFGCKRVNCNEMDRDRPRLPTNRNCCRLLCISWALAQMSWYWITPWNIDQFW